MIGPFGSKFQAALLLRSATTFLELNLLTGDGISRSKNSHQLGRNIGTEPKLWQIENMPSNSSNQVVLSDSLCRRLTRITRATSNNLTSFKSPAS